MAGTALEPVQLWQPKESRARAAFRRLRNASVVRSGLVVALLISGLFRLSAFIRETYIAARFGVSGATDAYFGLQQLPLSVAAFMFGAFALAFAPAYGRSIRTGRVEWLPGLLLHAAAAGLALMAITAGLAPVLLGKYLGHTDANSLATLKILSVCYVPIVFVGIWTSTMNATGHALKSMVTGALPYLVMTVSLIFLCEMSGAEVLTLPTSMAVGFGAVGAFAIYRLVRTLRGPHSLKGIVWPLRYPEFRAFSRQLVASAVENVGFAANQMLMIYFFGLMGEGQVTANTYAMRVGLVASNLVTQPLAQFAQSKFCTAPHEALRRVFTNYMGMVLGVAGLAAVSIFAFRETIVSFLFMHGKFTGHDVRSVASLIPAWLAYFIVLSVNAVSARYMFVIGKGRQYATFMIGAYALTNVMRAVFTSLYAYPPSVIWCAVAGEGAAMLLSLRICYRKQPLKPRS